MLEELGAGTAGEAPSKSQGLALGGPEDQTQEDADMEKVRTVPLDELAHPPAAPVERRLYLSDYLPPDTSRADRRIVRLRLEGYRYQEIAEKMGMTEIQCRVRLFRLREKLKKFEETLGNL